MIAARRLVAEARCNAQEARSLPKDQECIIVSGLPRSITSLMMQMLEAGRLKAMTDGKRVPDEDDPEGYWKWEDIRRFSRDSIILQGEYATISDLLLFFSDSSLEVWSESSWQIVDVSNYTDLISISLFEGSTYIHSIPEPGVTMLTSFGLGVALLIRRKRRSKA